ncbi:MAG TPA: glycosyltransferase family 39 protein, partial [Thermoanaerobaculia bacterium]|nr:glycosyltransferase family 39 protein [Thermoanaerobaculia bacterium]
MRRRTYIAALTVLIAIAVVRVDNANRNFSATTDEPAHLGDGYHWFEGTSPFDPSHPPLARILCALPLRVTGVPPSTQGSEVDQGNIILNSGDYETNLRRARRGNLVLFALAIIVTAEWARRTFSDGVALTAAALFTTLPLVLAHGGLITTDMAAAATLPLALFTLDWFLEKPSWQRAVALGGAIGLGLLAKLSFLVFFPAGAVFVLVARGGLKPALRLAPIALVVAFFVLWAGYRFTFDKPSNISKDAVFLFHYAAPEPLIPMARAIAQMPMPAPAYVLGVASLKFRDKHLGHPSYLLGRTGTKGWWFYFPVVFFYKTPLPFLLLLLWGLARIRTRAQFAYAGVAMAIMAIGLTATINTGLRHLLPMFVPLSILAAHGAAEIANRAVAPFSRAALAALIAWLVVGGAVAHPDYLGWFNAFAQPNPARIAIDSNLDWGQDTMRLAKIARELGVGKLHFATTGTIRFEPYGLEAEWMPPYAKTRGWVAVSESVAAMNHDGYRWLDS